MNGLKSNRYICLKKTVMKGYYFDFCIDKVYIYIYKCNIENIGIVNYTSFLIWKIATKYVIRKICRIHRVTIV